mgnify:CR=1 FL=1
MFSNFSYLCTVPRTKLRIAHPIPDYKHTNIFDPFERAFIYKNTCINGKLTYLVENNTSLSKIDINIKWRHIVS